jgi:hypothetical protein
MALLGITERLEVPAKLAGSEGQWVDVRQLSMAEIRKSKAASNDVEPMAGEEKDEAAGYAVAASILEKSIVAWSDDADVSAENIGALPYKVAMWLSGEILGGDEKDEIPNASAPSSEL